jgi:hypothetical protein
MVVDTAPRFSSVQNRNAARATLQTRLFTRLRRRGNGMTSIGDPLIGHVSARMMQAFIHL